MSKVIRTAGVAGNFNYTLSQVPAETPVLTIYSDAARTLVAVAAAPLVPTANPSVFIATYPATLVAGTYFLSFSVVMTVGQPAFVDNDDTLELQMVSGTTGEHQWVTGASIASDPRLAEVALPPEVTFDDCAQSATESLYKRTGRRYRFHSRTVRFNQANACGCSYDECSSTEVHLDGPVDPDSIVVTIAGVPLSPTAYHLYDRRVLVRHDGGYWPVCAHLSTPSGSALRVTYTSGQEPPADLVVACRELAIDVALQVSGKPSRLPSRTTNVSRRGVSINLQGAGKKTGIPFVDMVVEGDNPSGLTRRGSVTSPDSIRQSAL